MMSRIGAQMPGNYGQILHQTEQEQHQPANNPQWTTQQQNPQPYFQQQQQPQVPAQAYYPQQFVGQQPTQGYSQGQGVPTYDPNVLPVQPQPQGQRQISFDNTPPWAGMPGCAAAFDTGPPLGADQGGYSVVGQAPQSAGGAGGVPGDMYEPYHPKSGKLMILWKQYKDVAMVILIVYLLLKYAVPQAKRILPNVFGSFETSLPATALFALSVGGVYQGSKKLI